MSQFSGSRPLVIPSFIPNSKGIMPRELHTEEVQALVKKFIAGAVIARSGGAGIPHAAASDMAHVLGQKPPEARVFRQLQEVFFLYLELTGSLYASMG